MSLSLLDSDIIAYRCAASAENENESIVEWRVNDLVRRILHETGSETYIGFLTGSNNFRYELYPQYKANRKDKPKPKYLEFCRELLVKHWGCKITDGIEADDALGIEHQLNEGAILCSIDKDLLQLPGKHYNFVKQEWREISPLDGLRNFYTQLIEGDSSDNIPAFDGKFRTSRPKFVQKLLDPLYEMIDEKDMYCYAESLYGANQLEQMLLNAQLLYIHKKEGDIWKNPIMMDSGQQDGFEGSLEQSLGVELKDGLQSIVV